jgi:hypothetical protein
LCQHIDMVRVIVYSIGMINSGMKLPVILTLLFYCWSAAACNGGLILCVENQGEVEFEAGWSAERSVECLPEVADCQCLTCDSCEHYPIQICAAHRGRDCKAIAVENLSRIRNLAEDKSDYAIVPYQLPSLAPTVLCTVVLLI